MTPRRDDFEEFCKTLEGTLNDFTAGVRGHNSGDHRFRPRMLLLLCLNHPLGSYLQQTIGGDPDTLATTGVCAWGRYLVGSSSLRLVSEALHRAGIPGRGGCLLGAWRCTTTPCPPWSWSPLWA